MNKTSQKLGQLGERDITGPKNVEENIVPLKNYHVGSDLRDGNMLFYHQEIFHEVKFNVKVSQK